MKIENLKIGDRVKYYDEYNSPIEGTIYRILKDEIGIQWDTGTRIWSISKDDIICKLEPNYEYNNINREQKFEKKLIKYKEIPITHENLEEKSIKLSNLKLGDKIKFKDKMDFIYEGYIYIIELDPLRFYISQNKDNLKAQNWVTYPDSIISKLEPIIKKQEYKEIKIEHPLICQKCKKEVNGTSDGLAIYTCQECENKEKSAPKSFKFDINNLRKYEYKTICEGGFFPNLTFSIQGSSGRIYDDSLTLEVGKKYTIEIKEKE